MSLRRRIEKSERFVNAVGRLVLLYLNLVQRTTRWQSEGVDELRAAMAEGPVLLVMWHSRLMMIAHHWPVESGSLSSLHDTSPIARVVGAVHQLSGLRPMKMSAKVSNIVASRTVLKRVKDGVSIGLTADGPRGPALQLKDPPLEWARATGLPIFCYAFSTTRQRRAQSWDRLLIPRPFSKGAYVFARFPKKVPRKPDAAELENLREEIARFIDANTARADAMIDLPHGP
ncbi:hypothetical protein SAMN05421665_3312 [Yoonia rosea]|uniref:DUF374 domain-containing protein n=1 Tax=Yoonia rosea TaxID=287098 RepID=A0A1R3XIF6_9RHOB|nr:DUF374 domain-containing protein [Yoonia rosea]SIT91299.1 hypothetical protein SAMN05421665_3312 [Yoonia rosea]